MLIRGMDVPSLLVRNVFYTIIVVSATRLNQELWLNMSINHRNDKGALLKAERVRYSIDANFF